MNVFIVSKGDEAEESYPTWRELRRLGHEVLVNDPDKPNKTFFDPDVIINMGVTLMDQTWRAMELCPNAKLYCYNWDVYEWVWTRPRPNEYDYKRYGDLLRRAHEIWVPSECTGRRTTQWYGLRNWTTILSSCPWWEYHKKCDSCNGNAVIWTEDWSGQEHSRMCSDCDGTGKVSGVCDNGYALMCLREIPDPWWGVFERCCDELRIPYRTTRHEASVDEYRDAVAGCRFICAPLYELSTGGLSLMEAYYHGKPVLISSSEWNGAKDYFGADGKHRAWWFKHGDEDNFKDKLSLLYHRGVPVASDHKEYITTNFSDERMARDMHARITA